MEGIALEDIDTLVDIVLEEDIAKERHSLGAFGNRVGIVEERHILEEASDNLVGIIMVQHSRLEGLSSLGHTAMEQRSLEAFDSLVVAFPSIKEEVVIVSQTLASSLVVVVAGTLVVTCPSFAAAFMAVAILLVNT